MHRHSHPRPELLDVKLVEVNVAAGLVKHAKTGTLEGTDGVFTRGSWKARHLHRDVGYLGVMPLFEKFELLSDGSKVQRNRILDAGNGFCPGVPLTDTAWEHRTGNSPPPVVISLKDNRIVRFVPHEKRYTTFLLTRR